MKTKEKIQKLATKNYRSNGSGGGQYTEGLQEGRIIGFIDGYIQCQEDMVKEISDLKQTLANYNKEIEDAVDRVNKGIYISNDDVMNEIQNIIDDNEENEN